MIFILTFTGDPLREILDERIARRPHLQVRYLDTDRIPREIAVSGAQVAGLVSGRLVLPDGPLALDEIRAIWCRRLAFELGAPPSLSPMEKKAFAARVEAAVLDLLEGTDARWIDPSALIDQASYKPLQLVLAARAGLDTPDTILSNDARALRAFDERVRAPLIFKMLTHCYDPELDRAVYTRAVPPGALDDDAGIRLCPVQLQPRIEKALELRVQVIGQRVFTAAIDSQQFPEARDDWRVLDGKGMATWFPYSLPASVEGAVLRLMDMTGLQYGAVDLILTPDGRYVFLEVNPNGNYHWLESVVGLPITDALLDVLSGEAPGREPRFPIGADAIGAGSQCRS